MLHDEERVFCIIERDTCTSYAILWSSCGVAMLLAVLLRLECLLAEIAPVAPAIASRGRAPEMVTSFVVEAQLGGLEDRRAEAARVTERSLR